ncbi:MAG: T9SS type A sorting domain-containing protein [Flammeovirgaceae bacterium]|nr:T9SS type A sorting domain-containing protein [Flammeovirgaceae bacterium]
MKNFILSLLILILSFLSFNFQVNGKHGILNDNDPKIQSLTIYPNPTSGEFKVQIENTGHQKVNITIFNTIGKVILTENFHDTPANFGRDFNFENEKSGLYFVSVQVGEKTFTKKVVVE